MTHGEANKSLAYTSWSQMIQRCCNTNHKHYHHYGGRGITICPSWKESYSQFLKDMGPRPDGTCLDRIDNSKGYEPGNCRWATQIEQNNNQRTNKFIEFNGKRLTYRQWDRELGFKHGTISARIYRGLDPVTALITFYSTRNR